MTPGARLAAVIELLAEVDAFDRPADRIVTDYTRARRYMGSKDRRAVGDAVHGILRRRAQLDWHAARHGLEASARARALAHAVLTAGWTASDLAAACDGQGHRPAQLSEAEAAALAALAGAGLDHPEQPPAVAGNAPDWLVARLDRPFGDRRAEELSALAAPAPVDLRVNTLKAGRDEARAALAEAGIEAAPTSLSPVGLRCAGRPALHAAEVYRDGRVELQDESSQLAALLVDARPGMRVIDYCAGGGGKALALAACMGNDGELVACDPDRDRLRAAERRLARAGVTCARGATPRSLEAGTADRVLVDAPCTGIGAWRRHPDARWRLRPEHLERAVARQERILRAAWPLLRPGGRLVYATCTVTAEENEDQVDRLLADAPDARPVPMAEAWPAALGAALPAELSGAAPWLRLSPAASGTDGFFIAVLEKVDQPATAA